MSLPRFVTDGIRGFLTTTHSFFACCSACGEIAAPLGLRLCTSLKPHFPVDVVVLPPLPGSFSSSAGNGASAAMAATSASLRRRAPWIRRIYAVSAPGMALPSNVRALNVPSASPPGFVLPNASAAIPALPTLLCTARDLADQAVFLRAGVVLTRPLLAADFFTPNAIPLLFAAARRPAGATTPETGGKRNASSGGVFLGEDGFPGLVPGVCVQTRELAADFLPVFREHSRATGLSFLDEEAYFTAFSRWAFAARRAVLVPGSSLGLGQKSGPCDGEPS